MPIPINFLHLDASVHALVSALPEARQDAAYDAIEHAQDAIRQMLGILPPPEPEPITEGVAELLLAALALSANYQRTAEWVRDRIEGKKPQLSRGAGAALYAACCGLLDAGVVPGALTKALGGYLRGDLRYTVRTEYARIDEWAHKPSFYADLPRLREAAKHIALNRAKKAAEDATA